MKTYGKTILINNHYNSYERMLNIFAECNLCFHVSRNLTVSVSFLIRCFLSIIYPNMRNYIAFIKLLALMAIWVLNRNSVLMIEMRPSIHFNQASFCWTQLTNHLFTGDYPWWWCKFYNQALNEDSFIVYLCKRITN